MSWYWWILIILLVVVLLGLLMRGRSGSAGTRPEHAAGAAGYGVRERPRPPTGTAGGAAGAAGGAGGAAGAASSSPPTATGEPETTSGQPETTSGEPETASGEPETASGEPETASGVVHEGGSDGSAWSSRPSETDESPTDAGGPMAEDAGLGAEGRATGPYGPGSATPNADGSGPEGYLIKGNADSMIYHVPGTGSYERTRAEVWFRTEQDAQAAGYSAPRGNH